MKNTFNSTKLHSTTVEQSLHLAQLISDLSSAQKTVEKLDQLGYKQKTVKQNIEFLIDSVLEGIVNRAYEDV